MWDIGLDVRIQYNLGDEPKMTGVTVYYQIPVATSGGRITNIFRYHVILDMAFLKNLEEVKAHILSNVRRRLGQHELPAAPERLPVRLAQRMLHQLELVPRQAAVSAARREHGLQLGNIRGGAPNG